MEKESKKKIVKIILKTVAAAGILSMAILAPNALQALGIFNDNKKRKYNREYYLRNSILKLRKRGFIEFQKKNEKTFVQLTKRGEEMILKYRLQEAIIKKPEKWDKKWRIIIFDIKEYKKKLRDELRRELINLGFLKLQNSVWVYPYECEEIIIMLKAYFHIGKEVLYLIVEKIENDGWLKKSFNLS